VPRRPNRPETRNPEVYPVPAPETAAAADAFGLPAPELRGARFTGQARRARLNATAAVFVGLLILIVMLASANTRVAKLDWVIGSTHAAQALLR
jgi:hypothetical protein